MWTQQQQQQAYLRGLPSQHPQQQTLHPGIMGADDRAQHHHHHHQHHQHHHHRSAGMDLPVPSNPRASRNMAEKQRRDNLNTNISTMAALVPTVAGSSRRMDKISILRLAAAFLRTQYTLGRGNADFLPRQFNDFDLEQYFVDNLIGSGGFFIVVTTTGKIVYVSRQVEQQLGHAQNELLGQSLYNFVYPEDHEELTRNITPDEFHSTVSSTTPQITEVAATADNSNSSEDATAARSEKRPFREQRRSFKLRMSQRTISRREHTQYECLHISGMLRLADACKNLESNPNRAKHRELSTTNNDIVFVGLARLPNKRPLTELSIIDANKDEYVTRHLVDGRIIYCDHRVSVVAGYLSEEVSGLSAFSFMHKDDLRWTMMGLRQMYDRAETYGSSCYRLLSKTGEFIYLRTHGYLEYDKDTQTVVSFVCINTLVSEEEGVELVKEMKERFSATVTGTTRAMIQNAPEEIPFELTSDPQRPNSKGSLEDPSQLEDAITHLISDLPSPSVSEDRLSPSPMPNAQFAKAAIFSQRLPPAATQASKIGIKKIDHYLVLQGKGNRTPKQEPRSDPIKSERGSPNAMSMIDEVPDKIVSRGKRLEGESSTESTKIVHELMPENCRNGEMPEAVVTNDADLQRISLDAQNVMSNEGSQPNATTDLQTNSATCKMKIEQAIEILRNLEKQEPIVAYMQNGTNGSSGLARSDSDTNQYPLKRLCSDEDPQSISKRRHSDYAQIEGDSQSVSYNNFAVESDFQHASFGQYNPMHLQGLRNTESPSSSLHEINDEYQQLDPTQPLVANVDEDQLADLQDLKDDTLLSPGLDANPDLMMKIFDDLRPVMTFERTFNDMRVQQQVAADDQAVSEEIKRTHLQLANSMALRESQFSVLARDLEDPALHAQRENLTQLQAEHKIQKQILKTLQQDHHNMQVNVKHNIGV